MKVRDRFAAKRTVIDHQTVSVLVQSQFAGDFRGAQQQSSQQFLVLRFGFVHTGNDPLGNDEDMSGSLWRRVAKSEQLFVFKNDVSRDLP